jgi:hypothetical protein
LRRLGLRRVMADFAAGDKRVVAVAERRTQSSGPQEVTAELREWRYR